VPAGGRISSTAHARRPASALILDDARQSVLKAD
jgi:hypothetical protein